MACSAFGAELVVDLKLDGNFNDSQGNLTIANSESMTWTNNSPVLGSDKYVGVSDGNAAWNGTFKTVDGVSTAPSTTDFAISLFINASAFPVGNNSEHPAWTCQWIFGGGAVSVGLPKVGIGSDGQIKVSCHNIGGGINSGADNVITLNEWYHIGVSLTSAGTVDNEAKSVWTLFINGKSVASNEVDTPTGITWSQISLFEGKDATDSGRYKGLVDDIQIYNVTDLTDAKAVMSAQAARLVPEPTTATLSLLALAGLAARRRRK